MEFIKSVFSLNRLTWAYICTLPILMYLTVNGVLQRTHLEGFAIVLSIFIVTKYLHYKALFFIVTLLAIRFMTSGSIFIAVYDLSAIALLIYFTNFKIEEKYLKIVVFFCTTIQFIFAAYNFLNGNFMPDGRISSFFPSSMHYAFFTIGLSIANYLLLKSKIRLITHAMLIASAFFCGARAASLSILVITFLILKQQFGLKITLLMTAAAVFAYFTFTSDIRALNYVEESDEIRMASYTNWIDRVNLHNLLFGVGRYFLGSIGVTNNSESALITESSILTFIEAYGIVYCLVFISAAFFSFKKIADMFDRVVLLSLYLLIALISPFFETPSILIANVALIHSAIYFNKFKKRPRNIKKFGV